MTFCIDFVVLKLPLSSKFNTICLVLDSSAKHECATRAHPEKRKMKANLFLRASCRRMGATHLYALLAWQQGIGTEPPFHNPGSATVTYKLAYNNQG